MIVLDCAQRSDDWKAARLGRLCGSRAADMLATLKNGTEAASRRDLRVALALERITGQSQENGYLNADMIRGCELEPHALAAYEAQTGALVQPVGYCLHDTLLCGVSPDGFVGDDGLIEVKCPRSANHLAYLKAQTVPKEHLPQLVHQLWITGRAWVDFVSYDDRWPEPLRLFVMRYHRNDIEIATYEKVCRIFLDEVQAEVESIQALARNGFASV
jgi:hypothetical protein